MARRAGRYRPLRRCLHDHGHSFDHDRHHRCAWPHPAGSFLHSGGRCRTPAHVGRLWPTYRGDGGRGADAGPYSDRDGVSQCRHRRHGDRLLHQCRRASDRHGAPRRRADDAGRAGRTWPGHAAHRQCPPLRQRLSDGGFLLCRRSARADEAAGKPPRLFGADRNRPQHG
ncbi:hypothetical protein D3C86_1280370 [compost metagenome]